MLLYTHSSMHIKEILKSVGLTNSEAKTYRALYELQETKTGELCKHTTIASSNIYRILDQLISKGLATYRVQNNVKLYAPTSPEALNDLFLDKQNKIEEQRKHVRNLIDKMKTRKTEEPISKYRYYEGLQGIKSMWHDINQYMKTDMTLRAYTGTKQSYEKFLEVYDIHHKLRTKNKIRARMIFPFEDKQLGQKKNKDKYTEIKYMKLENQTEWGVIGNWYYTQYIIKGKKSRSFLIQDKLFAKTYSQVFDSLWNIAQEN